MPIDPNPWQAYLLSRVTDSSARAELRRAMGLSPEPTPKLPEGWDPCPYPRKVDGRVYQCGVPVLPKTGYCPKHTGTVRRAARAAVQG